MKIFVLQEIVENDKMDSFGEKYLGRRELRPSMCLSVCMCVYEYVEIEKTIQRDSRWTWQDNPQPTLIQRESRVQSQK